MNINSVRNKLGALEFIIRDKFDFFLVSESKLDSSFPEAQFKIPCYGIFGQDRDKYGGGLCFRLIRTSLCKKTESLQLTRSTEMLKLEIILEKEKLLNFGTYKPSNIDNSSFLNKL